jgi:chemotaxis protein MotB
MAHGPDDPSGVMVYPKINVPKDRKSDPSHPKVRGFGGGSRFPTLRTNRKWIIGIAIAAVIGGIIGFIAAPSKAGELDKAKAEAADAKKGQATEKDRADSLDKSFAALKKDKETADKELEQLSTKAADVDKRAAKLAEEEKKVGAAIDNSQGSVETQGDEIHLKLVDKVLFPTGEDALTDKGKQILDKVAVALKDLPDKQVWVQGHTDDQPIFVPPAKKDPHAKPLPKGAKPVPPAPGPVKFITNWELSAARALQVVHYLQDVAKIDPGRLAALAFGQYRPVSRTNKAANRRIEIVLYPKREILVKDKKK